MYFLGGRRPVSLPTTTTTKLPAEAPAVTNGIKLHCNQIKIEEPNKNIKLKHTFTAITRNEKKPTIKKENNNRNFNKNFIVQVNLHT